MYNIEHSEFAAVFLIAFAASSVAMLYVAGSLRTAWGDRRDSGRQALLRIATYFFLSWLTSLVIVCLYLVNGAVFDSSSWRVYGAQAIVLHCNQLIVPLLLGWSLRRRMNALLAAGPSFTAVDKQPIMDTGAEV